MESGWYKKADGVIGLWLKLVGRKRGYKCMNVCYACRISKGSTYDPCRAKIVPGRFWQHGGESCLERIAYAEVCQFEQGPHQIGEKNAPMK